MGGIPNEILDIEEFYGYNYIPYGVQRSFILELLRKNNWQATDSSVYIGCSRINGFSLFGIPTKNVYFTFYGYDSQAMGQCCIYLQLDENKSIEENLSILIDLLDKLAKKYGYRKQEGQKYKFDDYSGGLLFPYVNNENNFMIGNMFRFGNYGTYFSVNFLCNKQKFDPAISFHN